MKMIFDFAAGSDKGLVRKNNEDNLYLPGAPVKDRNAEGYFYEGKLCEEKAFFVYVTEWEDIMRERLHQI